MKPQFVESTLRQSLAIATVCGLTLVGCKKGEEEAAMEESSAPAAAAEAAPKPPPEVKVTLAKKWPAGGKVVFEKSVTIARQPTTLNAVASEQFRSTSYAANFGGGDQDSGDGRDGGMAGGGAATTLAKVIPLQIVGQKLRNSVGGKPFVELDASMDMDMGGEGERGGDDSGDPTAARPHPLATSVQSSVGATVSLTYDATGAITKVDGLQQQVHARVLRGVPRAMFALVGGMFSETMFREAMMFHGPLNGAELKQGDTWVHNEKGMLMLNWQQDFVMTNTFTGMKDWNGQKVAEIQVAGSMSGTTQKPSQVTIQPGATFSGTALYSPDLGLMVEQNLNGAFVSQEGSGTSAATVSNTFSRVFKVTSVQGPGEMEE